MSRLIKSHSTISKPKENRVIKIQPLNSEVVYESPEANNTRLREEVDRLLSESKLQANQMILEAQSKLQQTRETITHLKEEWEIEKVSLTELAQKNGYEVGYQQGEIAAKEHYTELLQEAKMTIDRSKVDFIEQVEQSEEVILKLGLKVAEKILKGHIAEKKEDFILIVKNAIKEVKDYSDINIIVHPLMHELVLSQKEELRALFNREKNLFIYPNEELKETDCVIESSFGRIDASIDSQLVELKLKLLDLLQEE